MPLLPGFRDILIDEFGGLNTLVDRMDLPAGASPDCQDVEFIPGGVKSRHGFSLLATGAGAVPNFDYRPSVTAIRSFVTPTGTRRLLAFDSAGNLYKETAGTSSTVFVSEHLLTYAKIETLYGRAYACISDGKVGVVEPVQYDDTNLDRVTGGGPFESSLAAADSATAGNIPAGDHYVKVVYETRNGALWPSNISVKWTAAGSKKVDLTGIPIGPEEIKRKHFYFSDVVGAGLTPDDWYFVTTLNDNSTTTLSGIDFTTASLYQGTSYNQTLARLIELPPQAGVIAYHDRLFFWGGLHSLPHEVGGPTLPYNLSFNGPSGGTGDGWTAVDTGAITSAVSGTVGKAWVYTRAAGTFHSGRWENDADLTNVFRTGQSLSVRFRANSPQLSLSTGSLKVGIKNHSTVTVNATSITHPWQIFSGVVESGTTAIVTADKLFIDTTDIGAANGLAVDFIEIYETNNPTSQGLVWASRPSAPEEIDALTGFQIVGANDGQDIRDAFVLHGSLYYAKERSIYRTTDDGSTEPALWQVQQVSDVVGTPSLNGVGIGDNWVVIAARSGLYLFDGATFSKISQEIQPTWDSVNWQYGHTLWVQVDAEKKRILVGLPIGTAIIPSATYVLDYVNGFGEGARKWAKWTFTGTAAGISERADFSRKLVIGTSGNTDVSVLAYYDETARKDSPVSDLAIDAYYETAPIGLNEGVAHIGGVTCFASGSGAASLEYTNLVGTQIPLAGFELSNPARNNVFRYMNLAAERLGFRFGTDALTDWFLLSRITVHLKAHGFFVNRGYNP